MKKFISLFLVVCMLGATVALFSGCGLFKKKIDNGTEAAQLLLANERLDESITSQKLDLGIGTQTARTVSNNTRVTKSVPRSSLSRGIVPMSVTSRESSSLYTWSGFAENYSRSMIEFSQFIKGIEHEASVVSDEITKMKKEVGVVDKWVAWLGGEKQMLRVFENAEVLLCVDIYDCIHVYYRYTNESAKNVYEMYSFMKYDDGTTGEIKTLFIPNERYEYSYSNSGGFEDLFVAENSRGYWLATRFSYNEYNENREASFYTYAIKDGLGFGSQNFLREGPNAPMGEITKTYEIFDPKNNRDLLRITESENLYSFVLHSSAIESGLNSVTGNVGYIDEENGIYFSNEIVKIDTDAGEIFTVDQRKEGKLLFSPNGDINYDYAENVYTASLTFEILFPELSLDEACYELEDYLSSIGIKTHCDMDEISSSIELASALSENFNSVFEWNGYTLSSVDNVLLARDALYADYDAARLDYEAVKDYETVRSRQVLSDTAHFAPVALSLGENSSFDGTEILISELLAVCSDLALFEEGESYVLKIGLSLLDENGSPSSVNTVALSGGNAIPVSFNGGAITLSQNGAFTVPKNLDRGEYALVAYVATSDGGIRVSEMEKIGLASVYEGEIESSAMYMESYKSADSLIIKYEIKNFRQIELEATKESYSYEEILHIMTIEILAHGAPYSRAVLETGDGNKISSDSSLGIGTYRIMCYLPTSDGLAQSYVYLTVK